MADHTKIEWTDATWNPIRARNRGTGGVGHFCVHASPGCKHCYSERMQPRFQNAVRFGAADIAKVDVFLDDHALTQPLRWKKPRMIFACSMTDLFGDWVPDEWIDRVFAVMALAPQHTFQVLTKRAARMREYLSRHDTSKVGDSITTAAFRMNGAVRGYRGSGGSAVWPLPNVWLGVSVEDQTRADERIPDLLATPAAIRWISAEPMLGPVDLTYVDYEGGTTVIDALAGRHGMMVPLGGVNAKLNWVVAGGESGPGARPMHPDWVRSLRDQCAAAGVPFMFKQWGEWLPIDSGHPDLVGPGFGKFDYCPVNEPGYATHVQVGKKRAGRLLDGVLHDQFPQVAS